MRRYKRYRRRRGISDDLAAIALTGIIILCMGVLIHMRLENKPTEAEAALVVEASELEYLPVMLASDIEIPATESAAPAEADEPVHRYPEITADERTMIAALVWLEARGEPFEGQQAVAEVVMNRVLSDSFPDTVEGVIYQRGQFSPAKHIAKTTPTQAQYDAVDAALCGEGILPLDVVYFSSGAQNSRIWGKLGDHVFCYI